ncbi:MAG: hypothetical protein ACFB9M_13370 [Myxococcota bacterium]
MFWLVPLVSLAAHPVDFDARFQALSLEWGTPVTLPTEGPPAVPPEQDMKEALRFLLSKHQDLLTGCTGSDSRGRWIFELALRPTGRLSAMGVRSEGPALTAVTRCLEARLLRLKYPRFSSETREGHSVEIKNFGVPVVFTR